MPRFADYVPLVGKIRDEGWPLTTVVRAVAAKSAEKGYIASSNEAKFAESLRKTVNRSNAKAFDGPTSHGNALLSRNDEIALVGLSQGFAYSGEKVGQKRIRVLAEYLFDCQFSRKW